MLPNLIHQIDPLLANLAQQLRDFIQRRGLLRTPLETLQAEQELAAVGRALSDQMMESLLVASIESLQDSASPGAAREPLPRSTKTQSVGRRCTPFQLLGGRKVSIKTSYRLPVRKERRGRRRGVGRRGKAGSGVFPHRVTLGILHGATPAVLSEVSGQAAESPSVQLAQQNLARRGLCLDGKTLTRLTQAFGRLSLHLRQAQMLAAAGGHPATGGLAGHRVVAAVDGGRMRIREPRRRGRRRTKSGRRGFDAPWREPKVLVVYVLDDQGKKARHHLSLYDATLGDAAAVFTLLVGYLRLLGVQQAEQLVLIGDGARWIWDRVDDLVAQVGIAPERFVAIVNYYHAVEHLRAVAELVAHWSAKTRRRFVRHYKGILRTGEVEEVIAAIDELDIGRRAAALATERDYFARNAQRMRYAEFERRGLPLGSGAVESAVRQLVNQRLKSNGMFWLQERAEHMLHLCAFVRSGRWEQLFAATLIYHCVSTEQKEA